MYNIIMQTLGLAFVAGQAWAMPTSLAAFNSVSLLNRAPFPDPYNHTHASLRMRQNGFNSECEVGDGQIIVFDDKAGPGQCPQAFNILWDAIANGEMCGSIGCNGFEQKYISASQNSNVCIRVQGDWASADRSYYVDGASQLFDRTRTCVSDGSSDFFSNFEVGTDQIFLRRQAGGFIQVQLTIEETNGGGKCPDSVSLITQVGSISGPVAPFFGLVGLICGTAVTGQIGP